MPGEYGGPERRAGYGEVIARLDGIVIEQRRVAGSIERIEHAIFVGDGEPPLLSRVTALETRGGPSKTERGGVISIAIGAVVTSILAYFGIRPGHQ